MFLVNSLNTTQHCSLQNIIKERSYTGQRLEALGPSSTTTGHLHKDTILLLRPESFRVLLSCANEGFCYSNPPGLQNLNMKGKTKFQKDSGRSSNMTPPCKWPVVKFQESSSRDCILNCREFSQPLDCLYQLCK